MRHRHLSNSFTRSGIEQHGNNQTPTEQSYFPTESGSFAGQTNHRNSEGRANEYPSSNISIEVEPYVPVNPYSHSSIITENRSLTTTVTHVGPTHCPNYNVPSTRDVDADLSNRPPGNGGPLKRKRSGSFYSPGSSSSSSSSSSSQMPMEISQYRGGVTINGEDSSRNVRRYVPNHSSTRVFYHSAPGQRFNVDGDGGQWNCGPPRYAGSSHGRMLSSDMSGSRHETSHFHIGGSSSSHVPSMREDQVNHSRRLESSYGNGSRYSHYAHGGSSTNGPPPHTHTDNFSSRNSRHCSPGGWRSSHRSGRPRIAVERFPPHVLDNTTVSHDRMGHETMMTLDRSSFYSSSRNFSDQYRDLRLDIDSMSYEELLNLEETIGNVNTGLSEDNMSKCLREKFHLSLDQNRDEVSCPICLEEYKNGDKIGKMEKCGHDYHVDCIKKWLSMKKLCPVCRTECSN